MLRPFLFVLAASLFLAGTLVRAAPDADDGWPSSSPSSSAPDADASADLDSAASGDDDEGPPPHWRNHLIVAHAVLGTLTFVALVPAALLAGRWLRRFGWWLHVHRALNVLAVGFVVANFGMGYKHVEPEKHWVGTHPRLGLSLLLLMILQAAFGALAHRIPPPPPTATGRPHPTLSRTKSPLRLLHIATGLAVAACGLAQVQSGITLWNAGIHFPGATNYNHAILWSVAGVEIAVYVGGWVWEERRVRREVAAVAGGGKVEGGGGTAGPGGDGGERERI